MDKKFRDGRGVYSTVHSCDCDLLLISTGLCNLLDYGLRVINRLWTPLKMLYNMPSLGTFDAVVYCVLQRAPAMLTRG